MPLRNSSQWLVLGLVVCMTTFVGLGTREMWNPTEARYAGIAAELLDGGNWLVPRYNGEVYDQKPPLYFWMMAASLRIGGEPLEEGWARLPSAVGAFLLAAGTMVLGRRLFGPLHGFLGAMLLTTCWLVFWSSRFAHMDTLMSAAMVWLHVALLATSAAKPGRRWAWITLSIVCITGGLLLKGPLIFAFPLLTHILYSLFVKRRRWLLDIGFPQSLAASFVLVAAWFYPAWKDAGDDWAKSLVIDQGVKRLANDIQKPKHSHGYYPGILWALAAPWSPLFIAALTSMRKRLATSEERRGELLLGIWFVSMFAVLMAGAAPQGRYLMPLFAPMFLLIDRALVHAVDRGADGDRLVRVFVRCIECALVCAATAIGLSMSLRGQWSDALIPDGLTELYAVLEDKIAPTIAGGVALLVTAIAGSVLARRRGLVGSIYSSVATVACAAVVWAMVLAPAIDVTRGNTELHALLRPLLADGRPLAVCGIFAKRESTSGFYRFYHGRFIERIDLEGQWLARQPQDRHLVVLISDKEFRANPKAIPADLRAVSDGPVGSGKVRVFAR